ncbi:hypothetical protein LXL04_002964 [Taraxacum kok-saghyz]
MLKKKLLSILTNYLTDANYMHLDRNKLRSNGPPRCVRALNEGSQQKQIIRPKSCELEIKTHRDVFDSLKLCSDTNL